MLDTYSSFDATFFPFHGQWPFQNYMTKCEMNKQMLGEVKGLEVFQINK
jgi:hypothetical protein